MKTRLILLFVTLSFVCFSQENTNNNKFKQLDTDLPTPNSYRSPSGAPGHEYWQQRADYKMNIEIVDSSQVLKGKETITYYNNSPDALTYLWLQMDQNVRAKDSHSYDIRESELDDKMSSNQINRLSPSFEGGFNLTSVVDKEGKPLKYIVNKTMMRIELPQALKTGETFTFKIGWWYNINNTRQVGGRSGYEHFEEDNNNVYVIAQFFPENVQVQRCLWLAKQTISRQGRIYT